MMRHNQQALSPYSYLKLLIVAIILLNQVVACSESSISGNDIDNIDDNNKIANELAKKGDINGLINMFTSSTRKINKNVLHAIDMNGWTPLHESSRAGNILLLSLLIENGANVHARTKQNIKPLGLLIDPKMAISSKVKRQRQRQRRYMLARIILEQGEKGLGLNGHVIDREAILSSSLSSSSNNNELILQFPNLSNVLAQYGLLKELKQLYNIDKNSITEIDANGWTPLHEAVREGSVDVIAFLLDNGADIDAKTIDGQSVLDIATKYGGSNVVNICLHYSNEKDDNEEEEIMMVDDDNDNDNIINNDEHNNIENEQQPTVKLYSGLNPCQLFFRKIRKLLSKIKLFFVTFVK